MTPLNILGVDLSLRATGIALPQGSTMLLEPSDSGLPRAAWIINHVQELARTVDVVVLEDALHHMPGSREITGVHYALQLRLWGINKPVALVAPATLKLFATGKGNAKKPDLRMALYKATHVDLEDDNEVDAWWLRAAALEHYGMPAVDVPEKQSQALNKVFWPANPDRSTTR